MEHIYVGCKKCDYKKVDVLSVREDCDSKNKEKPMPTAIITYICPNCGWLEEDEHYLYK